MHSIATGACRIDAGAVNQRSNHHSQTEPAAIQIATLSNQSADHRFIELFSRRRRHEIPGTSFANHRSIDHIESVRQLNNVEWPQVFQFIAGSEHRHRIATRTQHVEFKFQSSTKSKHSTGIQIVPTIATIEIVVAVVGRIYRFTTFRYEVRCTDRDRFEPERIHVDWSIECHRSTECMQTEANRSVLLPCVKYTQFTEW